MNLVPFAVLALAIIHVPAQTNGIYAIYGQASANVAPVEDIDRIAMQVVCENDGVSTGIDGRLQCDDCPSYTGGHLPGGFHLEAIYRGHFSSKDNEQLLLMLGGCEPHAGGFGGSVLLTANGPNWKRSGYFGYYDPGRCLSFRNRNGFDRLVCQGADSHFGNAVSGLYSNSYDVDYHVEPLLTIGSNLGGGAAAGGHWCFEQEITSFEKLRSSSGFTVTVTQTKGPVPAWEDDCNPDFEIKMGPTQTIILNFLFNGDRFTLAPKSEAGWAQLRNFIPKT